MTRKNLPLINRGFLAFLLIFMAMVSDKVAFSVELSEKVIEFKLGNHIFHIPEKNSLEKGIPGWLRWLPGLDNSSREVLITFTANEVSGSVEGYQAEDDKYTEDVRGLLVVMNNIERLRYEDASQYKDLWDASGSYQDRIVEEYKDGLYKVFRRVEYPYSWALLKRNPEERGQIPNDVSDFWVAHCLDGRSSVTERGTHTTCKSRVIKDDMLIEFNVSEQNIGLIEELGAFLISEITSWELR